MIDRAAILAVLALAACGTAPGHGSGSRLRNPMQAGEAVAAQPPGWEFDASALYYALPNHADFAMPIVTADRGALHLEARYQYEDLETGSLWAGWNFGVGDDLRFEGTLMAGAVFGRTDGAAPGYSLTVGWGPVELYTEGEYLFDFGDRHDSYAYGWSELSAAPTDWLRLGFVGQRTRVFEAAADYSFGPLVGLDLGPFYATLFGFDPWDDERFWVIGAGVGF